MPTTFLDALKTLAEETGDFAEGTTTALGTTSTLICSTYDNSNLSSTEEEDVAVLIESGNNAGQQRFVRRGGGLDNSTGTLTFADEFTNAVASGVTFSAYGRMPALSRGDGPSYQKALGRAARRLSIERTISFVGTTDLKHYPVDTAVYPWFTSKDRVIELYHPRTNADDILVPLRNQHWDWDWNGQTYTLVIPSAPWKTGETGYVKVYAPANSLIRQSGTWTNQTSLRAGMSSLDDAVLSDLDDVVAMGKAFVYDQLAKLHAPGQTVEVWTEMAATAYRNAARRPAAMWGSNRRSGVVNMRPVAVAGPGRRIGWR